MASLGSLPECITMNIVRRLPVESIARLRCVCKDWYEFLKSPKFVTNKMHHQHAMETNKFSLLLESCTTPSYVEKDGYYYTVDFNVKSSSYHMAAQTDTPPEFDPSTIWYDQSPQEIVSCDGVIGLLDFENRICLWNPSTRQYTFINHIESYDRNTFSRYGICYDWKIDDYKLFMIVAHRGWSEAWVTTLRSNSWSRIGDIPYDIYDINLCVKPLNGIIHGVRNYQVIVSFDIVEERTKELQIPSRCLDQEVPSSYDYMEVGVLGEELYLLVNPAYKGNIDLWVMKTYGVVDSWTKIFTISEYETGFEKLSPLGYLSKNGEILLKGEYLTSKDSLVSYDPKSRRLVTLDIPGMPEYFRAATLVRSLVSPGLGKFVKDAKVLESGIPPKEKIENPRSLEQFLLRFAPRPEKI